MTDPADSPVTGGLQADTHVHGTALRPAARRRLAALVGDLWDGARLLRVVRLRGGLAAHMSAVDVEVDGERRRLALRRYVRWLPGSGRDPYCARHAAVLPALAGTGLPVAELLWVDADGDVLGVPALLTTLLPGRSSLVTATTASGLDDMARALAAINRLPVPPVLRRPAASRTGWAQRCTNGPRSGWRDAPTATRCSTPSATARVPPRRRNGWRTETSTPETCCGATPTPDPG
jgi:aminoglycoside phosphotransferase (APT) family kinase protein